MDKQCACIQWNTGKLLKKEPCKNPRSSFGGKKASHIRVRSYGSTHADRGRERKGLYVWGGVKDFHFSLLNLLC